MPQTGHVAGQRIVPNPKEVYHLENAYALKGDICYSQDMQTLATCKGGYLVCENGVSQGVYAQLPEQYNGLPVHDYGEALIIPGLVDLHVHAPQFGYRTLGMDMELLEWLNTLTFPEEAKYRELAYAAPAYDAFVDDVKKGPNTRAVVFATRHVPATELLMDKLEASGLVTMVGKVNMDRNSHEDLQEESAAQSLADTRAWLEHVQGKYTNTTPILTPRFIPSCTDELMRGLYNIQRETGLPVQSHLSENQSECAWVKELCPDAASYGDAYAQFGLFGKNVKTIMAHCVWSDEDETALMAQNGVFIAHCPQSNMNIASGIAPVRRFIRRGIPMGLGSDVAGGCHTSIFRAMVDAVGVSKLRWRLVDQDDAPLTLNEAFYLATVGGGNFFGQVGSFAPGYEFDAVVIDDRDLAAPFPLTIEERLARVTYLSNDSHIRGKYVRGESILP